VFAVADGHGDPRHFRSARGSELATQVGPQVLREHLAELHERSEPRGPHSVEALVTDVIVPSIVDRWIESVRSDLEELPFSEEELGRLSPAESFTVPYGATLVLGLLTPKWLVLAQIGDGDAVVVAPDGSSVTPVPGDPMLDGRRTTSMCSRDAARLFRTAVIELHPVAPVAVMLSTDGFGNAQTEEQWHRSVGSDLVQLVRDNGIDWIRERLWGWTARCASTEGSGDDTSIVLVLSGRPETVIPAGGRA
jgi:hypothetical protein